MGSALASRPGKGRLAGRVSSQLPQTLYQAKKYPECIAACQAALKQAPHDQALLNLLALSYLLTGQDPLAIDSYARILERDAGHFVANLNTAKIHIKHKRHEWALPFLAQALASGEQREQLDFLTGVCQGALGREAEAVASYSQVLALNARHVAAYVGMANSLKRLQQSGGAMEVLEMGLKLIPDAAELRLTKAVLLMEQGLHVPAQQEFEVLSAAPGVTAQHLCAHAELLCRMRKIPEALAKYEQALELDPQHLSSLINHGNLLSQLKQLDQAVASYQKVLAIEPKNAVAMGNIASAMVAKRDLDQAWDYAQRAWEVNPSAAGALLYTMCFHCDWTRYDDVMAVLRQDANYQLSSPFQSVIFSDSAQVQQGYSERWAKTVKPSGILGSFAKHAPRPKIKIGYYSCDFFNHATAMLIEGMLRAHDRNRFELHAFSLDIRKQDDYTERLRSLFDHYHEVSHCSDRAVAHLSRTLEIDIAVDLKGYTEGGRPAIFAEGAAPVQVNFLGFPGSMGADFIDYIVADHTLVTPDNRAFFSEKVIYMPGSYQPNNSGRPKPQRDQPRPAELPQGSFVFCSFNNAYKTTPEQFKLWMRILRQAPDSVFWMLKSTDKAQSNLLRCAAEEGVDPARLIFAPFLPEAQHLTRLSHADLFLDSYPCNAHTTASDALWAGVPLLTRSGPAFASRVAGSLLRNAGLDDLIVGSEDDYEALALKIYSDAPYLSQLKQRVQHGVATGSLYDVENYTRHFEQSLLAIHERQLSGLLPQDIDLAQ